MSIQNYTWLVTINVNRQFPQDYAFSSYVKAWQFGYGYRYMSELLSRAKNIKRCTKEYWKPNSKYSWSCGESVIIIRRLVIDQTIVFKI
jgi:hypothetical protein